MSLIVHLILYLNDRVYVVGLNHCTRHPVLLSGSHPRERDHGNVWGQECDRVHCQVQSNIPTYCNSYIRACRFFHTNYVRRFMLKRPFHRGQKDKSNEYKVLETFMNEMAITVALSRSLYCGNYLLYWSFYVFYFCHVSASHRLYTRSAPCTPLPTASRTSCVGLKSSTRKWWVCAHHMLIVLFIRARQILCVLLGIWNSIF